MDSRKMRVIPEPAEGSAAVLVPDFAGPAIKGAGPLSYRCGTCDATLLQSVEYKQVQAIVIKCFGCGSFNDIPASYHTN